MNRFEGSRTVSPSHNREADWLGVPPQSWNSCKLRYLLREKPAVKGGSLPPGSISFGEVIQKEMVNEDTLESYQEVRVGDILVNPINLNYDLKSLRVALSTIDVRVSPAYIVLQPGDEVNPRYLRWLLYLFDVAHMKTLGAGVRQTITFSEIGNCFVCVPPMPEQERIANFLDDKTARIDALIAEKVLLEETLIELLNSSLEEEMARALANGSLQLRRALKFLGQGWSPVAENGPAFGEEWGVLKLSAVKLGRFTPSENKALSSDTAVPVNLRIRAGDLLVTRANTPELVGSAALVEQDEHQLITSDLIYTLRLDEERLSARFLLLYLSSPQARSGIEVDARGSSSSMVKLSQEHIRSWQIPDISLDAQLAIVARLESFVGRVQDMRSHIAEHIARLREYRSSLISAAVTGQLDISNPEMAVA